MSRAASPQATLTPDAEAGDPEPSCWRSALDCLAFLAVHVVVFFKAAWRVLKEYVVYPFKEYILRGYDDVAENLSPYKKGRKVPFSYTEVPGFRV